MKAYHKITLCVIIIALSCYLSYLYGLRTGHQEGSIKGQKIVGRIEPQNTAHTALLALEHIDRDKYLDATIQIEDLMFHAGISLFSAYEQNKKEDYNSLYDNAQLYELLSRIYTYGVEHKLSEDEVRHKPYFDSIYLRYDQNYKMVVKAEQARGENDRKLD